MAHIDWGNNKHRVITPQTWSEKVKRKGGVHEISCHRRARASHAPQEPTKRLEMAKTDLVKAGFPADADVLTVGRLNTAWYKLTADERGTYMNKRTTSGRPGDGKKAEKRAKTEDRKARRAEANTNMKVAATLGLNPIPFGGDRDELEEEAEELAARGFNITAVSMSQPDDPTVFSDPLAGGVLNESSTFDTKQTSVLVVRVASAGQGSMVSAPTKVDSTTMEVVVSRLNQRDFAQQLHPEAEEEVVQANREKMDTTLKTLYGDHMDYSLLNNAFRALAPENESWTVRITVDEPYAFGDIQKVLVCKAPNAVDAMIIFPLVREDPVVEAKAIEMLF